MKAKQVILGLSMVVLCATTQFACDSKKENKGEEVQEQKEDLQEAKSEGASEVKEQQADLDSARQDYKEAVKDSVRNN